MYEVCIVVTSSKNCNQNLNQQVILRISQIVENLIFSVPVRVVYAGFFTPYGCPAGPILLPSYSPESKEQKTYKQYMGEVAK